MKPYASYKPSGVPWLGEVPGHWEVNTIKRGYEITLGKMLQTEQKASSDVSAPYLRSANVQSERVDVSDVQTMWFSEHEVHQLALEPNDLVVCEGGDAGRSAIWYGEIDGCYFQNSVNRVRGAYNNTTFYLMRWLGVVRSCGYMDIVCNKATIAHLTKEKLANLPMLFPPPDEQQAIADYLDAETARIDTLIHEKDELIGLLREWRQSVIAEAVTKGLDKSAATKPSGVPWLGDVPSHWEVCSLRHAMDGLAMNGVFKKNEEFGDGVPLVNVSNLFREDFSLDAESLERVLCTPEEIEKYEVRGGDLFLVRSSLKLEGIAQFAVAREVNEPTVFECHVVRIRPDLLLTFPVFLSYYLNAPFARQSLVSRSKTTTMTTIDQNEALSTPLLLPPFDEQQAIADYLDTETAKIDDLIDHTHDEITLLKELRAATIADAVLGRVDVRTKT